MVGKWSVLASYLLAAGTINCLPSHSTGARNVPTPSEVFPQHAQLDVNGSFHLYWKTNATHITFEAHVRTRGYVGFGLSPNGDMYPADIVTGWVKHGHVYLQVRNIQTFFMSWCRNLYQGVGVGKISKIARVGGGVVWDILWVIWPRKFEKFQFSGVGVRSAPSRSARKSN